MGTRGGIHGCFNVAGNRAPLPAPAHPGTWTWAGPCSQPDRLHSGLAAGDDASDWPNNCRPAGQRGAGSGTRRRRASCRSPPGTCMGADPAPMPHMQTHILRSHAPALLAQRRQRTDGRPSFIPLCLVQVALSLPRPSFAHPSRALRRTFHWWACLVRFQTRRQ